MNTVQINTRLVTILMDVSLFDKKYNGLNLFSLGEKYEIRTGLDFKIETIKWSEEGNILTKDVGVKLNFNFHELNPEEISIFLIKDGWRKI